MELYGKMIKSKDKRLRTNIYLYNESITIAEYIVEIMTNRYNALVCDND